MGHKLFGKKTRIFVYILLVLLILLSTILISILQINLGIWARVFIAPVSTLSFIVLGAIIEYYFEKYIKRREFYEFIWKRSDKITHWNLLKDRSRSILGFNNYFFHRNEIESKILENLEENRNIILIGPPLSGKSRMLLNILKKCKEEFIVIKPKFSNIKYEDFKIPKNLFNHKKRKILILDDIHKYLSYENFFHLFISFIEKEIQIIATCNSGKELDKVENNISISHYNFKNIEISPITKDTAQLIAKNAGISWMDTEFDGNIGSIFLPIKEMRKRYVDLSVKERALLASIKFAFLSGIFEENLMYSLKLIKKICAMEEIGIEYNQYEFRDYILKLKNLDFLRIKKEHIQIEEMYLIKIINKEMDSLSLHQYEILINHLLEEPFVVRKIGENLVNLGKNNVKIKDYTDLALVAYQKIESSFDSEFDKATLYDRYGTAYLNLAAIQDTANNCDMAINYFRKALKYRTKENSPIQYAGTQNGLGLSYYKLADLKDFKINSKLSKEAFAKALDIFTIDKSPIFYSHIQVNLSAIFIAIANMHKKQIYSILALEALFNSLLIADSEKLPFQFGMINRNLGSTYRIIGDAYPLEKAHYYNKSIECSTKALEFLDDKYSLLKISTKETIANTYCTIAEITLDYNEKLESYKRSKGMYDSIITQELEKQNPSKFHSILLNYTSTLISYMHNTNDLVRINEVIEKLNESLKFYKKERNKIASARIYYNLGRANHLCAQQSIVNFDYCQDAIKFYKKSLKILMKEGSKDKIKMVEKQLNFIYKLCNSS